MAAVNKEKYKRDADAGIPFMKYTFIRQLYAAFSFPFFETTKIKIPVNKINKIEQDST